MFAALMSRLRGRAGYSSVVKSKTNICISCRIVDHSVTMTEFIAREREMPPVVGNRRSNITTIKTVE